MFSCSNEQQQEGNQTNPTQGMKSLLGRTGFGGFGEVHNLVLREFISNYPAQEREDDTYEEIVESIRDFNNQKIKFFLYEEYEEVPGFYSETVTEETKELLREQNLILALDAVHADYLRLREIGFISDEAFDFISDLINKTTEAIVSGKNLSDNSYVNDIKEVYNKKEGTLSNENDRVIINSIFAIAFSSSQFWYDDMMYEGFPVENEEGDYGYTTYAHPVAVDVGGAIVGVGGYALISSVSGNEMTWRNAGIAALYGGVTSSVGAALKIGKVIGKIWDKLK